MSRRMTCPGCDAYTSTVLERFEEGKPCKYCGLSAEATREILAARKRGADAALTEGYEELVKRADKADEELQRHRAMAGAVRAALADLDREEGRP